MKSDTSPDMQKHYREMLLARMPEERFKMGLSMCETARRIVLASLRQYGKIQSNPTT
ncbi:MAG: hypothetical protein SNJ66_04850 [Chloroherpetonaceae bacterium]